MWCALPADLDALAADGTADQSDAGTSSSTSGARRHLLQTINPGTPADCSLSPAPAVCTVPAPSLSILVKDWGTAQQLTQTPTVASLGPTNLTLLQLPSTVVLRVKMNKVLNNKEATPTINNGTTNNTLGPIDANKNTPQVFSYTLPRSYAVAPGTTTVYVSWT